MIEAAFDRGSPPFNSPTWIFAIAVTIFYILFLFGIDAVPSVRLLTPPFAPLAAVGGLLAYWILLYLITLRDPRIWRDATRFSAYLRTWAETTAQPVPDAAHIERLRLQARQTVGIAIAQQGGLVAGAGAGVTFLDHGGFIAILIFGGTMLIVGLALRPWLVGKAVASD